ncbi:MAG: hypothetical protein H3C31_03565 [Brumimicrobium sp.]|nr:hypothetical protein [Brumimicrobium sp.]
MKIILLLITIVLTSGLIAQTDSQYLGESNMTILPSQEFTTHTEIGDNWSSSLRKKKDKEPTLSKHFILNIDFLPLNYVNSSYYVNYSDKSWEEYDYEYNVGDDVVHQNKNELGFGFRIGGSYFFKEASETSKIRLGLDMTFLSAMVGGLDTDDFIPIILPDKFWINLPQPGLVISQHFDPYSGIDYKFNAGLVAGAIGHQFYGLDGSFTLKYWNCNFGVGLNLQYSSNLQKIEEYKVKSFQLGINVGLRF